MDIVDVKLPDDLRALRRLMTEYLREFEPSGDADSIWDDEYYVACEEGTRAGTHYVMFVREGVEPIGFVIARVETAWYRRSLKLGYVEELYVKPEYRRKGVGRAVVARACGEFRRVGARTAIVHVLCGNPGALIFWQRIGFELKVHQLFALV